MKKEHPNIAVLKQLDLSNLEASSGVIADEFVWHYFNSELPELEGDYLGVSGLTDFFNRLGGRTKGSFKVHPVSITAMGDEMVVTHVKDGMVLKGKPIEIDAVVVWSIVSGKIREAWDLPAVRTAKVKES